MLEKISNKQLEWMINNKSTFFVCSYYIDAFSLIYESKLSKELIKNASKIYYVNVRDFSTMFNENNNIYPVFLFIKKGKVMWRKCGFLCYEELFNNFTQKIIQMA